MSETNLNPIALYTLNPLSRFSDRAADYVKYRPSYPAAVIDTILDGLDAATLVAADIGAGTGISSRLLAQRGVLLVSPHFTNIRLATFANHQELDLAGLIGRVRSNSYTPKEGALLDRLILDLEKLHDRFQNEDGFVYLKYSTSLHIAEPFS